MRSGADRMEVITNEIRCFTARVSYFDTVNPAFQPIFPVFDAGP